MPASGIKSGLFGYKLEAYVWSNRELNDSRIIVRETCMDFLNSFFPLSGWNF